MRITRFADLGDVRLRATSSHLPSRVVTTEELFAGTGVDADEYVRLTGIRSRRFADPAEATSDLAVAAARPLVEEAARAGLSVDRLLVATASPDFPSPATAPLVQVGLGLPTVPSLDVVAACAGYVYALDAAARGVLTGDRAALIVAAETRSRIILDAAPGVRCLFGDGASAALLALGGPGLRLLATCLGADGRGHAAVRVEAGGSRQPASAATVAANLHTLRMSDGPSVFFEAVEGFVAIADALLAGVGLPLSEVDLVVPHQANLRILERVCRLLRLPRERMMLVVEETGNVGGASVGIALHRALAEGRVGAGARILLLTAGAGYTMGAALLAMEP